MTLNFNNTNNRLFVLSILLVTVTFANIALNQSIFTISFMFILILVPGCIAFKFGLKDLQNIEQKMSKTEIENVELINQNSSIAEEMKKMLSTKEYLLDKLANSEQLITNCKIEIAKKNAQINPKITVNINSNLSQKDLEHVLYNELKEKTTQKNVILEKEIICFIQHYTQNRRGKSMMKTESITDFKIISNRKLMQKLFELREDKKIQFENSTIEEIWKRAFKTVKRDVIIKYINECQRSIK